MLSTIAVLFALISGTIWALFLCRSKYGRYLACRWPCLASILPLAVSLVFLVLLFDIATCVMVGVIFGATMAPQVIQGIMRAADDYFEAINAEKNGG